MPKVSVIVPVYGVEKFVSKCIESILNQTYTDWELILVDDGSPDRSGAICEDYAHKDSRIKVYHKENGGVSSARNVGLDYAQGEWITFVDADDWLDKNAFSQCLPCMGEYDVIRFSMNRVMKEDGKDVRPFVIKVEPKEYYLARIVARDTILGVCGGMYRRNLFLENNIRFDHTLINGEDWVVLACLVFKARKCKIVETPLYNYNKYNETSCTAVMNYEKELSVLLALNNIKILLGDEILNERFWLAFVRSKCDLVYHFFSTLLLEKNKITKIDFDRYAHIGKLSCKEIFDAKMGMKKNFALLCFSNALTRCVVRMACTK